MPEKIIMVEEDRNFINRAKEFTKKSKQKLNAFKENYKKDYINTGKSQEFEQKIDDHAKKTKRMIKIAGTIATVALTICPADGPFGEICTMLATPGLCALVDLAVDIRKKCLITGKREFEKQFLNVDGSNGNIDAYNLENGEIINDFGSLVKEVNNFSRSRSL